MLPRNRREQQTVCCRQPLAGDKKDGLRLFAVLEPSKRLVEPAHAHGRILPWQSTDRTECPRWCPRPCPPQRAAGMGAGGAEEEGQAAMRNVPGSLQCLGEDRETRLVTADRRGSDRVLPGRARRPLSAARALSSCASLHKSGEVKHTRLGVFETLIGRKSRDVRARLRRPPDGRAEAQPGLCLAVPQPADPPRDGREIPRRASRLIRGRSPRRDAHGVPRGRPAQARSSFAPLFATKRAESVRNAACPRRLARGCRRAPR